MARNTRRRTYVVVDELASAGYLDQLPNVVEMGRGFGICTFLTAQSVDGLIDSLTETKTNKLLGAISNFGFLRVSTRATQEFAKCVLGGDAEYEQIVVTRNHNGELTSMSSRTMNRPAVFASEIATLPNFTAYYYCGDLTASWRAATSRMPPDPPIRVPDPPPASAQTLRPWSAADYKRFGLKVPSELGKRAAARKPRRNGHRPNSRPRKRNNANNTV